MLFAGRREGIDAREAAERIERDRAFVLDVRELHEWQAGRIPQAGHIPRGEIGRRLGEIPKDREVVAVCRSGARSGRVAAELKRLGYRVENLRGGMNAWRRAGFPVEPPDGRVA